ncbi:hypothetical protein BH23ACT9_BH23ACT9_06230 [soil metagenome]
MAQHLAPAAVWALHRVDSDTVTLAGCLLEGCATAAAEPVTDVARS